MQFLNSLSCSKRLSTAKGQVKGLTMQKLWSLNATEFKTYHFCLVLPFFLKRNSSSLNWNFSSKEMEW